MPRSLPVSEVLQRVLDDPSDDSSSSDDEILGDLVVGNESMVFTTPQSRFTVPCDTEPCLIDSALLNDDEVGEVWLISFIGE